MTVYSQEVRRPTSSGFPKQLLSLVGLFACLLVSGRSVLSGSQNNFKNDPKAWFHTKETLSMGEGGETFMFKQALRT